MTRRDKADLDREVARLREAERRQDPVERARELNLVVRTTGYDDPEHRKASVERLLKPLPPDARPALLGRSA